MKERGEVLPFPGAMHPEERVRALVPAVEALLFAAGQPVSEARLAAALGGVEAADLRDALALLATRYASEDSGLALSAVGSAWQLRTDARFATHVTQLVGASPARLSQAAMEALAVVAYRQPTTRREVEAVRGVASGGVLKTLVQRGLLRVAGRRAEPGRPLEYATTRGFLELFSLPDLGALPTLADREDLES